MNKEITVTCFDINNEGKGVVKFDSKIGFVDYLLPEEEAIIEVIYEKKDYLSHLKIELNLLAITFLNVGDAHLCIYLMINN